MEACNSWCDYFCKYPIHPHYDLSCTNSLQTKASRNPSTRHFPSTFRHFVDRYKRTHWCLLRLFRIGQHQPSLSLYTHKLQMSKFESTSLAFLHPHNGIQLRALNRDSEHAVINMQNQTCCSSARSQFYPFFIQKPMLKHTPSDIQDHTPIPPVIHELPPISF